MSKTEDKLMKTQIISRLLLKLHLFVTAKGRRNGVNIVEPIKKKKDIAKFKKVLSSNKRNLLLFNLGINSGLRISDILALNVKDVKDKEFIEIHEKKNHASYNSLRYPVVRGFLLSDASPMNQ